jgi:uncharacterized protein involved in cysteine biosynthesis
MLLNHETFIIRILPSIDSIYFKIKTIYSVLFSNDIQLVRNDKEYFHPAVQYIGNKFCLFIDLIKEMALRPPETYPIRGIFYLIRHPGLWRQIVCGLLIMIIVSIIFSVLLFIFAFPAQAYGLSKYMPDWIGWILSFFITLLEIGTSVLVFSSLFLAYYMDVIFDAVWRQETMGINQGQNQRLSSTSYSCIKSFFILIVFRVFLLVITSPLNLIPILGTILYIYVNGYYYAWSLHCRYFDLLGLTFAQGFICFFFVK